MVYYFKTINYKQLTKALRATWSPRHVCEVLHSFLSKFVLAILARTFIILMVIKNNFLLA